MKTFTQAFLMMTILVNSANAQYCSLPGRTPYAPQQPGITEFKLNTIDRISGNSESTSSVVVEATDTTVLEQGKTYTVTMKHSEDAVNFPGARNNIRVWIDYNNDKDFLDAGETVISQDMQSSGTFTATFTVPMSAQLGKTMIRATAKMSSDAGHTIPTSCDNPADPLGYHGEMEDYAVRIVPPAAINEVSRNNDAISIYPNPTTNNITVSLKENNNVSIKIELYDITGKLVSNLLTADKQASSSYTFNLNNYTQTSGIYFVKVTTAGIVAYQKVIKID